MTLSLFHPVTSAWFERQFGVPTEPQLAGWPEIVAGRSTLIAAPTGSGKTLAAFLACIDRLLREALQGTLSDRTRVVYVSPLKALSNDVRRNLEVPLEGIRAMAHEMGLAPQPIRALVRTGDTAQSERQGMVRRPPHILVTTPESLYLVLTSARGREILRGVDTVIVDEIHALVRDKRGSHLALTLERLDALCARPPVRIGLSATVKPVDEVASFLVGVPSAGEAGPAGCSIHDSGHIRDLDLALEVPPSELAAVCSREQWAEVHTRLAELVGQHRSTLVFVNTRRLSERVSYHLRELLGEDAVAAHHGSLSRDTRLDVEERLKAGRLKAIVATASLELGIDVGSIDLVCQIGSPRSIATLLQRVGRSGHSLGVVPKGRLFPLTRDELIEGMAVIRAVKSRRLDRVEIPRGPLDILAQQLVAAVACDEWDEDELYSLCRRAWPYRDLAREDYDSIVEMLAEGTARGRRRSSYLFHDKVGRKLRTRRGARLTALTCGGAIPESSDFRVVTEADRTYVGTVNEDFATEAMIGDVFLLGNVSWRIRKVRPGEVVVSDAEGTPASVPFWLGEAPSRTAELSEEVSRLREDLEELLKKDAVRGNVAGPKGVSPGPSAAVSSFLQSECGAPEWAARQTALYAASQYAAIGLLPTQKQVVFERFFDETGGMQLVVHAPFGGRVNRAWGLAMRKRFCRRFDFELQAAAGDNGIVLSMGPDQSMAIEHLFGMLRSEGAREVLVQALLAAPMFQTRWRWNATRSLAVLRNQHGKKVPPALLRFRSDDLLTAVFPAQTACQENRTGDLPLPEHPLVRQTIYDCLHEATDVDGWLSVLRAVEAGTIRLVPRDTREPSPFSHEVLNSNPYTFLDDAPLEERRARAVATRRTLSVESVRDLGRLDPEAIARVRAEAWPLVRDADELHDALHLCVALPAAEGREWQEHFDELTRNGRATELRRDGAPALWVASENVSLALAAFPEARPFPAVARLAKEAEDPAASAGWLAMVRGRLDCRGPQTAGEIASALGLGLSRVRAALEALEGEGFALRGRFTSQAALEPAAGAAPEDALEWCERRLLARIHRLTLEGLRKQIQPVEPADYVRFLLRHQHVVPRERLKGKSGVQAVVEQLQGFEIPAGAWEHDILPGRVAEYEPSWLDDLTLSGGLAWGRLAPPHRAEEETASASPMTRVVPISLVLREDLDWLLPPDREGHSSRARAGARQVLEVLSARGALFTADLRAATRLLPSQLEDALSELTALGLVTADGFASIRAIVSPNRKRMEEARRRWTRAGFAGARRYERTGRWSLFPPLSASAPAGAGGGESDRAEAWAWQLLHRYGVVFRDLLTRETVAPPWRLLLPCYRRLEARGEIRGGRFVSGVGGEQFASAETVDRLRAVRDDRPPHNEDWAVFSAADPVNLCGIVAPGPRVPAARANRVLLHRGVPMASLVGGKVLFSECAPERDVQAMTRMLEGR